MGKKEKRRKEGRERERKKERALCRQKNKGSSSLAGDDNIMLPKL